MDSTIKRSGTEAQPALREVDAAELSATAGGYDDWCGTMWRRFPWPPKGGVLDKASPA